VAGLFPLAVWDGHFPTYRAAKADSSPHQKRSERTKQPILPGAELVSDTKIRLAKLRRKIKSWEISSEWQSHAGGWQDSIFTQGRILSTAYARRVFDVIVNESIKLKPAEVIYHYTVWSAARGILCGQHIGKPRTIAQTTTPNCFQRIL